MNIADILEVVEGHLYSIHFEGQELDELRRCFTQWQDSEYMIDFFTHQDYEAALTNFFKNEAANQEGFSPETAMLRTRNEARDLRNELFYYARRSAERGTDDLGEMFEFLHKNEDGRYYPFTEVKLKGPARKSWLRLYAIQADTNLFFICGGGIKLTRAMQNHPMLRVELQKLEFALSELRDLFAEDIARGTFSGLQDSE